MAAKKSDKLILSLTKYYFKFILTISVIFIVAYASLGYLLSSSIGNRKIPLLNILNGDIHYYQDINLTDLKNVGGYVEVLDKDRNVIERSGDIPENTREQYSEEELLEAVSRSKCDEDNNIAVIQNIEYKGTDCKAIIRIPESRLTININALGVPFSVGKQVYIIYAKVIGILLALYIICIIGYSIWTAKKIKKPLNKIDKALGKIIDGDYSEKLNIVGVEEFVTVSNTINYLIDRLKGTEEENIKLMESKNKMLLDLSHDIKTPITSIRGFSAALYEGIVADEEQKRRYYETIYNKSERVAELVDDLFEFVKMDNVKYTLKLDTIDICEYLRQVIVSYFDEINEKKFILEINIPDEPLMLKIDSKIFKRVFVNLIENSLKYNPAGTKLMFEIRDAGRYVAIEISDDGVGIPGEIRGKIFDAFVRGDKSRVSDGGTGLGLSIAQKIVGTHGGEITLLNPTDDKKTIFYITMFK